MTDNPKKKKSTPTTTTTAPPITSTQFQQDLKAAEAPLAGSVPAAGGSGTSTAGTLKTTDVIRFANPNQAPEFVLPSGVAPTTAPGGATDLTGAQWMQTLHLLQDPKNTSSFMKLQNELKDAGFITSSTYTPTGHVDPTTTNAWRALGEAAVNSSISASTLLAAAQNAPQLLQEMTNVHSAISKAKQSAADVTNSNITLTDPNKVAQTFATAMESMGMGTPSPEQTKQFVNAFISGPQGEIAATQNQANMQKQNILAGAGNMSAAESALQSGNLTKAQAAEAAVGPTSVATKAQPNLDAEAIASAKSIDPSMYYATQSTDLYGMIQQMLSGGLQQPTAPASPTSQAASGGILTTPLTGAP